jgi:AcrR family transcriptional regulator
VTGTPEQKTDATKATSPKKSTRPAAKKSAAEARSATKSVTRPASARATSPRPSTADDKPAAQAAKKSSAVARSAKKSVPRTASAGAMSRKRPTSDSKPAAETAKKPKPRGREEVIESIIDATLSLWATQGPAQLAMRTIAERAGVNYGLVHRHFGTKDAVIRAAMARVVARSLGFIGSSDDLAAALDAVLPRSTGAHSRLIAWSILQYTIDDVMPEEDAFLKRMRELAAAGSEGAPTEVEAGIRAGSLLALLYGWRLFEPYLVHGLGLEGLTHDELNAYIRLDALKILGCRTE